MTPDEAVAGAMRIATWGASDRESAPVEHAGLWRRDEWWTDRCACGHLSTSHRHDLKASSPCATGGCDCRLMRPVVRLFREHRWVEVPLNPDAPTV